MKNVEVHIGDHLCLKLERAGPDTLRCRLPAIPTTGSYPVSMTIDGQQTVAAEQLTIQAYAGDIWLPSNYYPGGARGDFLITCRNVGEDLGQYDLGLFSAYLKDKTSSRRIRLRALELTYDADTGHNLLTTFFAGCSTGEYELFVEHENYGLLHSEPFPLKIGPTIMAVSAPLEGSLLGGT